MLDGKSGQSRSILLGRIRVLDDLTTMDQTPAKPESCASISEWAKMRICRLSSLKNWFERDSFEDQEEEAWFGLACFILSPPALFLLNSPFLTGWRLDRAGIDCMKRNNRIWTWNGDRDDRNMMANY